MNQDEFEQRLLLYGSDFRRWPSHEAEAAQRLLAGDGAARALLEEARRLDAVLTEALGAPQAPGALAGRIVVTVSKQKAPRLLSGRWKWRIAGAGAAAALAATAVTGFVLGSLVGGPSATATEAVLMGMAGADVGIWSLL